MHKEYVNGDGEIVKRERKGEKNDGVPVAIPLRFQRAASLNEVVRRMVRSEELARIAAQAGAETFEEADDFDVGDDYEPSSPYEEEFEGLPVSKLRELQLADIEKEKSEAGAVDKPPTAPVATSGDGQK